MQKKILLTLSLFILLLAACAPAATAGIAASGYSNQLSVTGQSQVTLVPDIAYVSIGVRSEGFDVARVVSENATAVDSVMAAIEAEGVPLADMQTTNFSVYSYDQFDNEGNREGLKYNVENTVYITVRNLSRMGDLLDRAIGAGANSIWGIQFDVADKSAALSEAREKAMQDATLQAQELASLAGVTLGDISSVSFTQGGSSPYPIYADGRGGGGAAYDTASTTIVPGQITVSANVFLSYEIE